MQPVTIYESVAEPTSQTTIADVLFGAMAVVLGLAAVALVLGGVLAGVLIGVRRIRRRDRPSGSESDMTRLGLEASSEAVGSGDEPR